MDIELPSDFQDFLKLLNVHGVEYLLIDGYAVNYYGYSRATQDMDIWIAMSPENAARVVKTLKEFGFEGQEYCSYGASTNASRNYDAHFWRRFSGMLCGTGERDNGWNSCECDKFETLEKEQKGKRQIQRFG